MPHQLIGPELDAEGRGVGVIPVFWLLTVVSPFWDPFTCHTERRAEHPNRSVAVPLL